MPCVEAFGGIIADSASDRECAQGHRAVREPMAADAATRSYPTAQPVQGRNTQRRLGKFGADGGNVRAERNAPCVSLMRRRALPARLMRRQRATKLKCAADYFLTKIKARFIYVSRAAHSRVALSRFQSCRYAPAIQPIRVICRRQSGSRVRRSARWIAAWAVAKIRNFPAVFWVRCPKPRKGARRRY